MSQTYPKYFVTIRGSEPLVVSLPHAGGCYLNEMGDRLASRWLTWKDTDWYVERL